MSEINIKIADKEYSEIAITKEDGELIASITAENVIEKEGYKVACIPVDD